MEVKIFKAEHLELAEIESVDEKFCTYENMKQLEQHMSGTFMQDGRVVAFAGIVKNGDAGEVWVIPTIYLKQYRFSFIKQLQYIIETMARSTDLKKMQSSCFNTKKIQRWMKLLGFKNEGKLGDNDLYVKRWA